MCAAQRWDYELKVIMPDGSTRMVQCMFRDTPKNLKEALQDPDKPLLHLKNVGFRLPDGNKDGICLSDDLALYPLHPLLSRALTFALARTPAHARAVMCHTFLDSAAQPSSLRSASACSTTRSPRCSSSNVAARQSSRTTCGEYVPTLVRDRGER
jgi:hypothetical protein